jgi:SAM-dependent methyltransferase
MRLVKIKYGQWKADLVRKYTKGLCLDLGCLSRIYEGDFRGQYVGADISKGEPPPNVICDAEHLPFWPNTFDTVVAFDTIEHLNHPETCLAEISRTLRKDGLFLATTPNAISPSSWWDFTHKQHFTRSRLASLIGDTFKDFQLLQTGYPTLKFAWLRSLASMIGYADSFIVIARKDTD